MNDLISIGLEKGLIKFDSEQKNITYIHQNKKRNFTNPEEKVQAEAFLKLIVSYGYPVERIVQFKNITMGSTTKEVDIIVYNDDECTQPYIIVECKKEEVSELEFKQAVNQGASYTYALSGTIKYLWVTSGILNEYYSIDKESDIKQTIPDIPVYGVNTVQEYKYAKGGRKTNEEAGKDECKQKYFELETVTEDDLTRRFKQAHNALWAGGELNPSEAFDELDKLIFCKIWDERSPKKKGKPYLFQIFNKPIPKKATDGQKKDIEIKISKELYDRIKALYSEGKKRDPEVFKDDIRLSHAKVKTVVGYLEAINLSATDLDSKGKAFETFMGSYFRGDFGQFFTPRPIVKFIVNTLPIKNNSRVLDTSCGSGGFLLYALDKVRLKAREYYPDYKDNPQEATAHYKYWHDFAEKNLFGIEINEQIARSAKMNMIIHDDGHTNVITSDGLLPTGEMIRKSGNKEFKCNSFDFIITNPPFGSVVKQTERAYLHQYGLGIKDISWLDVQSDSFQNKTDEKYINKFKRENQSTEVLFIEQCWNFLKEGGFIAIVLPDGVLTNSSLQYVRDNIEEWYRIVAVVSMPQTAFAHTGAGVKSSVLFLRKWSNETTEKYRDLKNELQNQIRAKNKYIEKIEIFEKEKKEIIREHRGFINETDETDKKIIEKTAAFKEWKKEISEEYTNKLNDLKEDLNEQYQAIRQKKIDDYQIFMAIAEDIGYDATGKPTGNNELEPIAKELTRFIEAVERGEV